MTIVLAIGLCNPLLYNAKNGYENTYDMRAKFFYETKLSTFMSFYC